MKVNLTVCDVCRDTSLPAKTYRVQSNGRTGTTDRCDEHGALFEEVLNGDSAATRVDARPKRQRRNRTTTIEEIERQKAERNSVS